MQGRGSSANQLVSRRSSVSASIYRLAKHSASRIFFLFDFNKYWQKRGSENLCTCVNHENFKWYKNCGRLRNISWKMKLALPTSTETRFNHHQIYQLYVEPNLSRDRVHQEFRRFSSIKLDVVLKVGWTQKYSFIIMLLANKPNPRICLECKSITREA